MYYNLFENWADVQKEYQMNEPEPDEVLVAHYGYESYEGDSTVLYRNGDKYYYQSGGHCSCYGLEGQWGPEEYTAATLLSAIERVMNSDSSYDRKYGFLAGFHNEVLDRLQGDFA